jgi:hypothetical protein
VYCGLRIADCGFIVRLIIVDRRFATGFSLDSVGESVGLSLNQPIDQSLDRLTD